MKGIITLNTAEAAAFLGLAKQTLYNLRSKHAGPPWIKLTSSRVVYLREDLEHYCKGAVKMRVFADRMRCKEGIWQNGILYR
jgi:predicted DNA-binding transcriptional regulator AlpA